jgi:hypothetical protein
MARTVGIWVFGLLASAIVGGMVGSQVGYSSDNGFLGALAGMFAFACLRLWLAPSKNSK